MPAVRDVFFLQARQRNTTDDRVAKRYGSPIDSALLARKAIRPANRLQITRAGVVIREEALNRGRVVGKVVSMNQRIALPEKFVKHPDKHASFLLRRT